MNIKSCFLRWGIPLLLLAAFLAAVFALNRVDKVALVNREGQTFEKGVVVDILQDNLMPDGSRVGEQRVLVRMTTGVRAGQELETTSASGFLFGAGCTVGMKVVVMQSVAGDSTITSIYSQDREWVIYAFAAAYLLVLCLVGGKQGLKGALGLVFTFFCILFVYLPLVYRGWSPFWVAVLICIVTTLVTMYLIGGPTRKTVVAAGGTVAGVVIAGLAATLFSLATGITGWNVSDIESLLTLASTSGIQVGGLLQPGRGDGCSHVHRQRHRRNSRSEPRPLPPGAVPGRDARGAGYDGHRLQHPDSRLCRRQHLHAGAGLRL